MPEDKTLYLHGGSRFWLANVKDMDAYVYDKAQLIYFRQGHSVLYHDSPTWFDTIDKAIEAAFEAGFDYVFSSKG